MVFGQGSKLNRNMHGIRYNEKRDEFYVTNSPAQAILTFRGAADGQEPPIRVIQGPKTMLDWPDSVEVDEVHEELIVSQRDYILFFSLTANGDVAPIRAIRGGSRMGWYSTMTAAVDPIHNVVVSVGTVFGQDVKWHNPVLHPDATAPTGDLRESLLIFDRTANGEVKPLRVIRGPKTGMHFVRQIQIQPSGGWIVISQMTAPDVPEPEGAFVGVWSIHDDGDVPPRWKIEAKPSNFLKKPNGIALDPKHKELIVADMTLNAVLTFYFPEIF